MQMIEGRQQMNMARQKHAIAKHIAGHITDADDAEVFLLHIYSQLTKMPPHRHPGPAGGDAHGLVVIAVRAAGGKAIPQPELVLGSNTVGDVRECSSALVRRHHQVTVVPVPPHHIRRRQQFTSSKVVGNIQHATDEGLIGFHPILLQLLSVIGLPLDDEAALGTGWHDDRVLYLLRLHQTQHLGAIVLATVRPAQPAASHRPASQMHPFHISAINEDLKPRPRLGHAVNSTGVQLEGDVVFRLLCIPHLVTLKIVSAQGGIHQVEHGAQHTVLGQVHHFVNVLHDLLPQFFCMGGGVFLGDFFRAKAGAKVCQQTAAQTGVGVEGVGDELRAIAKLNLL